MDKWFIKRDFSIPITHLADGSLQYSDENPAEDSLFKKLWNTIGQTVAEEVLETDFFKGIRDNNLNPKAYGSLSVQDAYYCFKAQDSYAAAATHPLDKDCADFLAKKYESYASYNESYHSLWHIREASGVIPGKDIKEYAAHESYVAGNLSTPYLFCVMLPCEYLWNWVANRLATINTGGLYRFWIEENMGTPSGANQMANMLERYRSQIDETKAENVFTEAMNYELKVFTAATNFNNELWQKKNSI